MSSSSSADMRPEGNHHAPRRGGRTLKKRLIRIEPDRRDEIDLHYLGQALLRLAQEQYDLEHGMKRPSSPGSAPAPPHETRPGPNGSPGGTDRVGANQAPTAPYTGATG